MHDDNAVTRLCEPEGGAAVNLKAVYAEVRDTLAEIVMAARETA